MRTFFKRLVITKNRCIQKLYQKQVVLVWQSLSLKTSNHKIKVIWQFKNLAVTKQGVYRFIQTSYFRFIQNIIPPVHLDRHTSGTSRVFIPPVHLDFIHTSGSSRFFFIPLVHLEHHTSGSSRFFSYLWFIQNFIPLVHLEFFCRFLHANCISDRSLVKYDCNLTIF